MKPRYSENIKFTLHAIKLEINSDICKRVNYFDKFKLVVAKMLLFYISDYNLRWKVNTEIVL